MRTQIGLSGAVVLASVAVGLTVLGVSAQEADAGMASAPDAAANALSDAGIMGTDAGVVGAGAGAMTSTEAAATRLADAGSQSALPEAGRARGVRGAIEKVQVDADARSTPGIDGYLRLEGDAGVDNRVRATPTESDEELAVRERIQGRLQAQRGLSLSAKWVKVEVHKGSVTLSGGVNTANEKARVERIAASTNGVRGLESHLKVRNRTSHRPLVQSDS